jgi:hypothetical protein
MAHGTKVDMPTRIFPDRIIFSMVLDLLSSILTLTSAAEAAIARHINMLTAIRVILIEKRFFIFCSFG